MELLPGFRTRPPQDEDAEEVAAFANEECIAFLGVPVADADWLRRRWTAPGVDRDSDFAVVESPNGELCAFLSVEAEPPFTEVFALGIVAPAFHGLGLGAAIVSENERRALRFEALAVQSARVLIHAGALAAEPRVSALLSSRGYREVRRFELRRVDFAGAPTPPRDVEGIEVRDFRPEEARQLYEAHVEAFADHWGEGKETYEDFRHHISTLRSTTQRSGPSPGTAKTSPDTSARMGSRARTPPVATSSSSACAAPIGGGASGRRSCSTPFEASTRAAVGAWICMSMPNRSPAQRGCTRGWG
jgi:GNAT superfamily N-acetyltransferase